jgi:sulfite reductase alpha subunit-like flavoprotein
MSALSGIKYGVMSIGSRVYPDFCQAGMDMDYWFRQTGAEQLLPLGKADELDNQSGAVEQWIHRIAAYFNVEQKKALVLSGDLPSSEAAEDEGPPVIVTVLKNDDSSVKEALEQESKLVSIVNAADGSVGTLARFLPDGFALCRVTRNSELVDFSKPGSKNAYKSTRFLEFDLSGATKDGSSTKLTYATGDHAKIMPCNAPEVVQAMCNCLDLDPATWVQVKVQEGMGRPLSASVAKVSDILTMEIDLATQDKDGNLPLLEKLLAVGRSIETLESENLNEQQMATLRKELVSIETMVEQLSEKSGGQEGKETPADLKKKAISHVMETYLDVPSLLKGFPFVSSKLSLADCIEVLPRHKPSYYSIASSAELHPTTLQLTVGVLTVPYKSTKQVRKGICSNYLAGTTAGAENGQSFTGFVRLGVNTSSFRLPSEMTSPVIMVGPGTGISPMMGFLQAREKAQTDGVALGPCMVFFGCRTEDDFFAPRTNAAVGEERSDHQSPGSL